MSPVIDLLHTSWMARDGAPAGISGITQTPDGWIWIGSSSGLYKFDGVRFTRSTGAEAPLSSAISSLGVLKDGTLWVSYKYGGLSLLSKGRMRHFRLEEAGTPEGTGFDMAEDEAGRVWFATSSGLHVLGPDSRWQRLPESAQAPKEYVLSLLYDRGTLWVRTHDAAYALHKGATQFVRLFTGGIGWLAQHPDGSVWTCDGVKPGLQMLAGPREGQALKWNIQEPVGRLFFDRDGYAWFASAPDLVRTGDARSGKPVQRSWPERGLSGVEAFALFQDREFNMWIGTENGLDRFRKPRLQPVKLPENLGLTARPLAGGPGASAWVDGSYLLSPDKPAIPFAPRLGLGMVNTALYRAPDGKVWFGGEGGPLFTVQQRGRQRIPTPDGIDKNRMVYALAQDSLGALWVSFGRAGLYTLRSGNWSRGGGYAGLKTFAASAIATDPRGAVWLGSVNNQLAVLVEGQLRRYSKADGLTVGSVMQILPVAGGAWIGGENGLSYFDGKHFNTVTGAEGDPLAGITGLSFGDDGKLWINGGGGISSIEPGELQRAIRNPDYPVRFDRLDYRDGLTGATSPLFPVPSIARSEGGMLWFSTTGGVYAFEPGKLATNTIVPPVAITSLRAGATSYPASEGLRLAPGTSALEIDFTALSYQDPERVRFRYRLEGVDGSWRDSGRLRMASYTNLGPGHYRFRVIGANNDGVWNMQGASISFDIQPKILQTTWFRILSSVAFLIGLWTLYNFKTRLLARRYGQLMRERLSERERIARTLHDTLLQSMHGVVLRVSSVAKRLPHDSEAKQRIESIISQAGTIMEQGRSELLGLRSAAPESDDIAKALVEFGQSLQRDFGPEFNVALRETPKALHPIARPAIYCIGREAIFNAYRHGAATQVRLEIAYGSRAFLLSITDDGNGVPDHVLQAGGREGHWGMAGMRERAMELGGSIDIKNRDPRGTEVVFCLPASRAYLLPVEFSLKRWFRSLGKKADA